MSTAIGSRMDAFWGLFPDWIIHSLFRLFAVLLVVPVAISVYVSGRWLVQALADGVTVGEAGQILAGVVGLVAFAVIIAGLRVDGELEVDG